MGINCRKPRDSLATLPWRRGIGHPGPLIKRWTAQIRAGGRERRPAARTVPARRHSHCRRRGLAGARDLGPKGHGSKRELDGEKEESKASSPRAKIGGGDEARTADHGEQQTLAFYKE